MSTQPNNLLAQIDQAQAENAQGQMDALKLNMREIRKKIAKGEQITDDELNIVRDFKVAQIRSKVLKNESVSDQELSFLQENVPSQQTETPVDERFTQAAQEVPQDIGLRFQEGFLDKPELFQQVAQQSIEQRFPGEKVETRIQDGQVEFSVGGSDFSPIDPTSGDPLGEIAEQVGRFGEPVAAITAGLAFPGAPIAAGAAVTGIAQGARELSEAFQGLNDQTLQQRFSDVGLKIGFDTLLGNIFKGLGTSSRALERAAGGSAEAQRKAGAVLEEKFMRNVEDVFKDAKPKAFAKELQGRIKNTIDQFKSGYKQAFKSGDQLALAEARSGNALPVNMMERLLPLQEDLTGAVGAVNRDLIDQTLSSIGKTRSAQKAGQFTGPQAMTALDLENGIKFIDNQLKFLKGDLANQSALLSLKKTFREGQQELAQAGSKAAQNFVKGTALKRQLNDLFPEDLVKKTIETAPDDFGRSKAVDANKFLQRLTAKGGFDDAEIQAISKFSGLSGDNVLADVAGTQISVQAPKGFQERASKNLVGSLLPRFSETRTGERLVNLPESVVKKAEKLVSVEGQESFQKAGGQLSPNILEDIITTENTRIFDPAAGKFIGQESINARALLKNLTSQVGETAEEGLGGKISGLVGREQLQETVDPIQQLKFAQEISQNQFIKQGPSSLSGVGPNTIRTGLNASTPGLGNLLQEAVNPALRGVARVGNIAGQITEPLPGVAARSLVGGLATPDPDSPIQQALRGFGARRR